MSYQDSLSALGAQADVTIATVKDHAAQLELDNAALVGQVADLQAQLAALTPEPTPDPEPVPDPMPDPLPQTPPLPNALTSMFGVRVFPQYGSGTYGKHDAVLATLGRLGVKRISGLLTPNMGADEIAFYQQANKLGIKVWFAIGTPGVTLSNAQWLQVRNLLAGPFKGMVEVASGWNEANNSVAGDWVTLTSKHQLALYPNVKQVNSETGQDIKVGTPPLWSGSMSKQYADLLLLAPKIKGFYDWINWHMYPHGLKGAALEQAIETQRQKFIAAYGDVPMLNSESGYFTPANYSGGSNPSTEAEQADQIDDLINYHVKRGIRLSYFELLNDPDPAGTNREANFGLIRTPSIDPATWADKPAFGVVQKMLAAL